MPSTSRIGLQNPDHTSYHYRLIKSEHARIFKAAKYSWSSQGLYSVSATEIALRCAAVFTRAFKRQKAKTKAELVAEISRLKEGKEPGSSYPSSGLKLDDSSTAVPNNVSSGQGGAVVEAIDSAYLASPSSSLTHSVPTGPAGPDDLSTQSIPPLDTHQNEGLNDSDVHGVDYGVPWLGAGKANACFDNFHRLYAPFLPGIWGFSQSTPAEYFAASPFLFWTIIATGARRYGELPLLHKAADIVQKLASDTILSGAQQPLAAIKAVLLLCIWPIPKDTLWKDPSPALIGAAVQLAIQQGLHIAGSSQQHDFARTVLHMTEEDRAAQTRLWAYCVTVFQK
ncbi:hypothetical protein PRZ48_010680 [Zasmidium cellare]|uniref:Xylanolytic transcriptional activator regulatory domain-containing protein n=1 Tax=Zasmidium cellare TaxID=395010 RepID=A0ABR0E9B1_ZASCE|nr:hypothetical protein PRZ48_010680 [Zasmidium cellare]